MNITKPTNENKLKILGFQQPLKLKASVTSTAFLLIFRNYAGEIVASWISLLPLELTGKREQSALYALAVAKRMLDGEALQGYRIALIQCAALPPDDYGPVERKAA